MDVSLRERRELIEQDKERFADRAPMAGQVATAVVDSWTRCQARVPAALDAAPLGEITDDRGVVGRAAGELLTELGQLAVDQDYVAALTDARGCIVWSSGGRAMTRLASRVNFVEGGCWDEAAAGTNAPALALATGRTATVFASEHWCEAVRDWVCYAAPIRAPSGEVIGALDLSSFWRRANPMAMSTVSSIARLIEQQLQMVSTPQARVRLELMGATALFVDGRPVTLPLRQLEILAVLAMRSASVDELHALLYGDRPVSVATLKAEVSHLRQAIGGHIASRPYRLTCDVSADFVEVLAAVRAGDVTRAARLYRGPLLVGSDAPFLEAERNHVDVALRDALLRSGDATDLLRFGEFNPYDVAILERAEALATPRQRPEVAARLAHALSDD